VELVKSLPLLIFRIAVRDVVQQTVANINRKYAYLENRQQVPPKRCTANQQGVTSQKAAICRECQAMCVSTEQLSCLQGV